MPCPRCQRENRPQAKLCEECGASPDAYTPKHLAERVLISKTVLEGERKQVTVLFADLEAWAFRLIADASSQGDSSDMVTAADHYHRARTLSQQLGMRPLVAHCHLGLGKLYRRIGDQAKASEHLSTATTMYREMDIRFWLEKADAELRGVER
jgi:Tetratricopeptide repeat